MNPIERADEIDRRKRIVEDCYESYRRSLMDYAEWMVAWRERQKAKRAQESA